MADNPFDGPYGRGATEYEKYLRTGELLGLQKPPEHRTHPDELFFQTMHQVEELWMKLAIHELGEACLALGGDGFVAARASIDRAGRLLSLCEMQLRMFETMQPAAYLVIRGGLGHGSGLDSPGFVRLNECAPILWNAFDEALTRRGADLLEVYQVTSSHPDILSAGEAMTTFDANMQRFKLEHMAVVRRIIGTGTASLRGNPMEMLERSARLTYFPMLWAVRDRMFMDFKAGPLKSSY